MQKKDTRQIIVDVSLLKCYKISMTETLSPKESNDRLFWPRAHEDTRTLAEVLRTAPEYPLSDSEKERVIAFENQLFQGNIEGFEATRSLADYTPLVDASFSVSSEYLETQEGAEMATSILQQEGRSDVASSNLSEELSVMSFADLQSHKEAIKKMQGRSQQHTEALYIEMAKGVIPEREFHSLNFALKPQETIDNFVLLVEYKKYLREVRKELEIDMQADTATHEAAGKYMITDIYRDKVNAMLAELYPSLLVIQEQANAKDDEAIQEQISDIPSLARMVEATVDEGNKVKFMRLLDYVRNGATYDSEGKLTPLDESLFDMLNEVNERPQQLSQPVFSEEEINQLRQREMDASEMQDLMETYLQQIGLSAYGWQVEIREDRRAFSVSGVEKKVKIPASFKRGVIKGGSGSGVAALVEHEIGGKYPGHVMQSVNAEENQAGLRLGREPSFRGKKYVANREAGGVLAEMGALEALFGEKRLMKGGYAAAMKVLIEDGSRVDAIRAFAESVASDPSNTTDASYKLAANRVSRLFRYGGRNSQPLDYVEAAGFVQVAKDLDKTTLNTMLAEAVFAPKDMMRLHAFDMLPSSSEHLFQPDIDPTETVVSLLRSLLKQQED